MTTETTTSDALIETAITGLDLERKVRLLSGDGTFTLHEEPSIGLATIACSDGPTGVRGHQIVGGRISCLLPNATLLAQHWNQTVMKEVGGLLAEEAADQQVHVVLGPGINLHRTPLGGRLFEAFSEDPMLTGHLAVGYVRGLQDRGIGASAKHYLANESETERFTVDSVIDEAAMREIYLLPFEIVVADANPWTVMASYNKINGTTATEHTQLLTDILKTDWGYDGVVVSDWWATTSTVASALSGLDLVMPGQNSPWDAALVEAVRDGRVPEAVIDEHVRRILRLAGRVGAFHTLRDWPAGFPAPDSPHRRRQLRDLAAGGMTVLTNRNNTLPLAADAGSGQTVALIGRHAFDPVAQGGGSAVVRPPHIVSVADALLEALGPDRVSVVDGVEVRERPVAAKPAALRDPDTGRPGMRITGRDATGTVIGSKHLEVTDVAIGEGSWADQAATIELSADLVLSEPTRMQIGVRGPGDWTLTAPNVQESFTITRHIGHGGGMHRPKSEAVIAELSPGDRISAVTDALDGVRILSLVARPAPRPAAAAIAEASRAARQADVAVVVVGLTQEQETEGVDKTTLVLPGEQDTLVTAVAAAARRTVVVVNAATPVLMPWRDQVDAIIWAGLPGQEAGAAITAALTGDIEPAGRLVTTIPARDGDGPAWTTTPVDGQLEYSDGSAVGYRGWDSFGQTPAFWFGHGLGYSTWDYQGADLTYRDGMVDTVQVRLTNTGQRNSQEAVQVYLRPADPAQPIRLIGWTRQHVAAGEEETVDVACDPRLQRRWDPAGSVWQPLIGGTIIIARGLGDPRLTVPVSAG